jgi:peptidoglycan-N-acetylglucosamine deacetylase
MTSLNRRTFLKTAALAGSASILASSDLFASTHSPQIAITMDDPRVDDQPGMAAAEVNARILGHLKDAKIKAALFVCGMRVDSDAGRNLLASWNDAGHLIGNHTYSHKYFPSKRMTLAEFQADSAHGEQVIASYSRFQKIFRFPFFKEGDTQEKRDGMRTWLQKNGYSQGRATVDASDWAIDARLVKRLKADVHADSKPYRDFYLQHIWNRAQYYDSVAQKVLGYTPKHTLLIHHSLLNAMFLGDLLAMFKTQGWKLIDARDAFSDPAYAREPNILPAGESLVWALAKETGRFEKDLRYPGEDDTYENPAMDELGL